LAKEKRCTIAVPNRDDFKAEMVMSLMQIVTQTGSKVNLVGPQTCYIDDARNQCWDEAKAFDSDWLLFMDSDNNFNCNFNVFERMTSLGKDIVSGVYVMRHYPNRPLVYDFTHNGLIKNRTEIPKEPFTADATGCGLLLISRKVMDAFTPEVEKELGRPFNFLNYGKPNMLREDPAFCWRTKQLGFELWFDPTISMGHIGKHTFTLDHFETAKKLIGTPVTVTDKAEDGGIDGWMSTEELGLLKDLASKSQSVVEVGSWKGRSTKALLESCKGTVFAVDHWKGSDTIKDLAASQDVEAEFDKNVGHYQNLVKMKMPSLDAAKLVQDTADMVFIDGDHSYEGCKADIKAWLPKTRKVMVIHDYYNNGSWPGVKKAVDEAFDNRIKIAGTIAYVELGGQV